MLFNQSTMRRWTFSLACFVIYLTQQASAPGNLEPEFRSKFLLRNTDLEEQDDKEYSDKGRISFPYFYLPVFAPTSSVVQSELCRNHSHLFLQELERYELWALLMYDATAKFPSGILQGNVNQFGDFDECLSVNANLKENSERQSALQPGIQGRYCLAAIDMEATEDQGALREAVSRAECYGSARSNIKDTGHFSPRYTTINWGLCVPSSCSAEDIQRALKDELSVYKETAGVSFNVQVNDHACIDPEDLNFSFGAGTLLTMIFYLAVVSTTAYASYRDFTTCPKEPKGKIERLLMAFSWKRTTAELLSPGTDEEISCIHGIKASFVVMLYITHKFITLAFLPYHNRIQMTELTTGAWTTIFRAATIYTDSFLLISGVLLSFSMTGEIISRGRVSCLRRLVSRFIRLTPPLLAVVLFYGYISEELGSGPQWGPLVGKNAELCRQNFWKNLLYIQNFFDFSEMCSPQTHQLALDMQLSLTAPVLVYVLYRYDLIGLLIVLAIYLLSSALRYINTIKNELTLIIYYGVPVSKLQNSADLLYIQAIYRAMPYVLGVTIGYYLRKKSSELRKRLQGPLATIGWTIAIFLVLIWIITPAHLADKSYVYNVQEAAQYTAFLPICWYLTLGWVITACHLGFGGRLNDLLSSKPLLILSRMSYSIFLLQFLVFHHNIGVIRTSKFFTIAEVLDITEITTLLAFAFVNAILFAIPMREIKSILMENSMSSKEESAEGGDKEIRKEFNEDNEAQEELELEDKELSRNVSKDGDEEQYIPDEEGNGRVSKKTEKKLL